MLSPQKRNIALAGVVLFPLCLYILLRMSGLGDEKEEKFISPPSAIGTKEDPWKRFNFEIQQLVDPHTGEIPDYVHKKEAQFVKDIPDVAGIDGRFRTKAQNWSLAGPSNVGGRTRALALDITNENVIVAGGVSGGMWRSEDSGFSWTRSSHPEVINSASCVVQDTRPGKENIWYHGTGELRGNTPRAVGAPYRGDGIFKSTDGAITWDVLPATSDGLESQFNSPYNYVWNMVVDHTEIVDDVVYAAVYGGIIKSTDGGDTWQTVLGTDLLNLPEGTDLNDSGASFYTNIIITPSGVLYATLSVFTTLGNVEENKGVFKSTDGINWTNITPPGFAQFHQRTVMNYAPSKDNIIYFLVDNDVIEIWRYDNDTDTWIDRSDNVPNFEGRLGPFDSQGGYNMMIAVHPNDANIVYVGGTNLYRSTDGFSSSSNTAWIGGYDPEGSSNPYTNHHPDQHEVVFYPSDPNKMLSACDGGVRLTNDNLATLPFWTSLNNGYVTSQFYTVAISQEANSDEIIGGMQDNGTYLKSAPGVNQPWNFIFGGDGAFAASTDDNLFWYASFQESQVYRLTLNSSNQLTSFARVDPVGGSGYLFINPFVLDPNNFNRMYLAGGTTIWRNNNLSQVPAGDQEPTDVNWDRLDVQETDSNITALDISTLPKNILYAGTGTGRVLKIENANAGGGTITTILENDGYVVNVSVDPSNADNVMVAYSNYNIPSLYFSSDGGTTFTDVGGNLEEFDDGSGNGPSTRWTEIIPLADGSYQYFVGTSSGLYSTTQLEGGGTMWLREGVENIGRSVVRMMDYRSSDGRLVIATHGNGMFQTTIANPLSIQKPSDNIQSLVIRDSYPTPFRDFVNIEFTIPEQGQLNVRILDSSGSVIKTLINFPQFAGDVSVRWDGTNAIGVPVPNGIYYYRIFYEGTISGGKVVLNR